MVLCPLIGPEDAELKYKIAKTEAEKAKESGDTEKQAQAEAAMQAAQSDMAKYKNQYDTWSDGSAAKIALHAAVGALAGAATGSGNIAAGALSAAASEASSNLTGNLPRGVQPLASAIIGAATATAIGGNAQAGASTAADGDMYNRQLHKSEIEKLAELKSKWKELGYASEAEAESRLIKASCALTHCADGISETDIAYRMLSKVQAEGNTSEYARERELLTGTGLFTYTAEDAWRDQNYKVSPFNDINRNAKLLGAAVGIGGVSGQIAKTAWNKCLTNPATCMETLKEGVTALVGLATGSELPPSMGGAVGSAVKAETKAGKVAGQMINLASEKRTQHILLGDATGRAIRGQATY